METVFLLCRSTHDYQDEWEAVVDVYIKRDDAITEQNRLEKEQSREDAEYECWHITETILK